MTFFLIPVLITLPARGFAANENPLSVGFYSVNWVPFSYEADGDYRGFALDVVKGVLKQMRHDVSIERTKLLSGMDRLQKGTLDSFIGLGVNTERAEKYLFTSDPIYYDETVLVSRADDTFTFDGDVSVLIGERVAIINGAILGPAFDNMFGIVRVRRDDADFRTPRAYQGLLDGEYRFIALNARAGLIHLLEKMNLRDKFRIFKAPIAIKPYYLVFSKTLPEARKYAERFNRIHRLFRSTKEYGDLLKEYNLNDKLYPR